MCETEQRHGLQALQCALRQTTHHPMDTAPPAELTVGIHELPVRTQNRHGHGGLEKQNMVVDLLGRDDLVHLIQTLRRLLLRNSHLLLQVRNLGLEVTHKLDRLQKNADLALVDHGTRGLGSKRKTQAVRSESCTALQSSHSIAPCGVAPTCCVLAITSFHCAHSSSSYPRFCRWPEQLREKWAALQAHWNIP